ncbi:hypothetical protein MNBD_GAMMA09-3490 [hydrothermal vent metagenome]|uniref:Uncharacterized protein n=1 Tax=hydrothermal vent metagenome TaxID=652676 RepID=A0A3B0YC71_9ZZZZ
MSADLQTILQKAARKILSPLIRVMLRNGVACGSFEEMVRKVYIDEAFNMARKQGKATISGISAQTGLSRKEVKRLHDIEQSNDSSNNQKYNRAIRVISGWMNDPRFISAQGVSKALNMEGVEPSFATLVKDYSGDIPTRAMFELLQKSGCIEQVDNKVYLTSHAYVPGNDPTDIINIMGVDCNELMNTVIYNMNCNPAERRFQRKVSTSLLANEHKDAFLKYAGRRSQTLLEELDNWLSEHQGNEDNSQYISLGIYIHQDETEKETEK